ncbi:uncharacterized protein LOC117176440 [Belonocnema kinseyi]|uniref:uncharacterized protein LOC117176440 n=1 Tax=Belonocnema kinseyi TaxID=2817044 RepID=UPI00143DEC2B|nr:uncharacterized protein LOC117176440 [Belonocnema kinseyi]
MMANECPNVLNQRAFHPTDPLQGMRNYDLGSLSQKQKEMLNHMKISQRKENEIYLHKHPEIKGLISILLRYVLIKKPAFDVHQIVGAFFARSRNIIAKDLLEYLLETECASGIIDDLRKEVDESNVININDIEFSTENINYFGCQE